MSENCSLLPRSFIELLISPGFIDDRWGDAAPRTRKKVRAVLMSFLKWAQGARSLAPLPEAPCPGASALRH